MGLERFRCNLIHGPAGHLHGDIEENCEKSMQSRFESGNS